MMHRKTYSALALLGALVLFAGLDTVGASAAQKPAILAQGRVECSVVGGIRFKPRLTSTSSLTVMAVNAKLECSTGDTGVPSATVKAGQLTAKSVPFTTTCSAGTIGAVNGTIKW